MVWRIPIIEERNNNLTGNQCYTKTIKLIAVLSTKCFYVYILTNQHRTVLYTGVTNDLKQRIQEHYSQRGQKTSFTGKYHAYYLLYYEAHQYINNAIAREKEIKGWTRQKKMRLINEMNPSLRFLNEEVFGAWPPKEIESRAKS